MFNNHQHPNKYLFRLSGDHTKEGFDEEAGQEGI